MQVTAPLSVNDAADVAKSFAPVAVGPGRSKFVERTSASSAGYLSFTVGFSEASAKRRTNRIDLAFDMPIVETVSGENKVTRTALFRAYYVIPESMTATERADLVAFCQNLQANALVKAIPVSLDPMY